MAVKKAANGRKTASKTSPKKPAAKRAKTKAASEKKPRGKMAATKRAASAAKKAAAPRKRKPITPEQALANTRALLEAKNELAKQPPNYPSGGDPHSHAIESIPDHQAPMAHALPHEAKSGHVVGRGNQDMRSQS